MRERPILFSAPMVRAILEGRKTQTRRAVKLPHNNPLGQWEPTTFGGTDARGVEHDERAAIWHTRTGDTLCCPYGQPGDRLWVKETFATWMAPELFSGRPMDCTAFRAGRQWRNGNRPEYAPGELFWADDVKPKSVKWTPSIHMPRRLSRILLEVTDVRVERLQDIGWRDCAAEGIDEGFPEQSWQEAYFALWDRINGAGAAAANPWVWVVGFHRVTP